MRSTRMVSAATAMVLASTLTIGAQIGGKLVVGGNPTPGTDQPEPPNLADRITLTGCLNRTDIRRGGSSDPPGEAVDTNMPSDARFMLADAERIDRVPAGTGGSPATASASRRSYRLLGIDSQFSPFVGTKVEVSGEIKPAASSGVTPTPTLIVEFIQKLAKTCS